MTVAPTCRSVRPRASGPTSAPPSDRSRTSDRSTDAQVRFFRQRLPAEAKSRPWWRGSRKIASTDSRASWTSRPGAVRTAAGARTSCLRASSRALFAQARGRRRLRCHQCRAGCGTALAFHDVVGNRTTLGNQARLPELPGPDLEDWFHAYYGANYDRLVRVKGTYDPADAFHFHQSIAAPLVRSARKTTMRSAACRSGPRSV